MSSTPAALPAPQERQHSSSPHRNFLIAPTADKEIKLLQGKGASELPGRQKAVRISETGSSCKALPAVTHTGAVGHLLALTPSYQKLSLFRVNV